LVVSAPARSPGRPSAPAGADPPAGLDGRGIVPVLPVRRLSALAVLALAACGPRPTASRASALPAPWAAIAVLPARTEIAVAITSPAELASTLDGARDLGGDELAAWLAPRFAGRTWPLDRVADAGLDPRAPLAVARLDRIAATTVRCARIADRAALAAATADAVRAAALSPSRWTTAGVDILAAGDDALVTLAHHACFVHSGARSQRDRAAVELAAGDGDTLAAPLGPLARALGAGDLAVVARGDAAGELFASEKGADIAAAILAVDATAITSRIAATPPPTAAEVELGLPVDKLPVTDVALPPWPAAPRDDNPDVPLSADYERAAARLTALEAERQRTVRGIQLHTLEIDQVADRAFAARGRWRRDRTLAIATLAIPLPGGSIATAVAAARAGGQRLIADRERAIARYREAVVEYTRLRDELIHVRARDVAAHDRGPR
jgi:hypothetical protein